MTDDPALDGFVPEVHVVDEYEALAAGDFGEGERGRLLLVVSTTDLSASHGDVYVGLGLAKYLRRLGWGITLWPSEKWTEPTPEGFDVALVMIESFVPGLIHPDTRLVAWVRNWTDAWSQLPYLDTFDQIWCSSTLAAARMREVFAGPVELVPLGTDPELFAPIDGVERDRGVVTTANYWGSDRGLFAALELVSRSEPVTWFGRNMPYLSLPPGIDHSRRVDYFSLPFVYSAWHFVVDDAIPAAVEYGMQNSRLFDAIASGATVITNNARGLDELGLADVAVYEKPKELIAVLAASRENPEAAAAAGETLRAVVLERHTYDRRAQEVSEMLERPARAAAERTSTLAWSSILREKLRAEEKVSHGFRTRVGEVEAANDELRYWYELAMVRISLLEQQDARRLSRRIGAFLSYAKSPSRLISRVRKGPDSSTPSSE